MQLDLYVIIKLKVKHTHTHQNPPILQQLQEQSLKNLKESENNPLRAVKGGWVRRRLGSG